MNAAADQLGYAPLDEVIAAAEAACADIREQDSHTVLSNLTALAWRHPGLAAQTIMALAAWVDDTETGQLRENRIQGINWAKGHTA